jgi:hypothetical protein
MVNRMFMGSGDLQKPSEQHKKQSSAPGKVADVLVTAFTKLSDKQTSVRDYMKDRMNE